MQGRRDGGHQRGLKQGVGCCLSLKVMEAVLLGRGVMDGQGVIWGALRERVGEELCRLVQHDGFVCLCSRLAGSPPAAEPTLCLLACGGKIRSIPWSCGNLLSNGISLTLSISLELLLASCTSGTFSLKKTAMATPSFAMARRSNGFRRYLFSEIASVLQVLWGKP